MIAMEGTGTLEPSRFPGHHDAPWCVCRPALVLEPLAVAHDAACPEGVTVHG